MLSWLPRVPSLLAALVCLAFVLGLSDRSAYHLQVHTVAAAALAKDASRLDAELQIAAKRGDGSPVENANITVFLIRNNTAFLASFATTDHAGLAVMKGLPRGSVWVLADAERLGRVSTQLVLDERPHRIDLTMSEAHHLEVLVESDTAKPIEEAEVHVRCADPLPFVAKTGADGHATIGRLCSPPFTVWVGANGYEATTRASVVPGSAPLRVVLRQLGAIKVSAILKSGEPAPLTKVLLAGPGVWPARQTTTGAFGEVTIASLPSGTYELRALRGELVSPINTGIAVTDGRTTDVTLVLEHGRTIKISVRAGTADDAVGIAGAAVVAAEDGVSSFPVQGRTGEDGTVVLGPFPSVPVAASARAEGFIGPGAVLIAPDSNEARINMLKAATLTGKVADVRGFPISGASIELIGTDPSGMPVADSPQNLAFRQEHFAWALDGPPKLLPAGELGVMPGPIPPIPHAGQVSQAGIESTPLAAWTSDSRGHFSVYPASPGRISALVRHPNYRATVSDSVLLAPGATAHVKVVLHEGATLEGSVRDDRDFPIAGALVRVTARDGSSEMTTLTAQDGTFAFTSLASDVLVSASRPEAPEQVAYDEEVKIPAGTKKELKIVLRRAREAVEVRIVDDRDYPIDGAKVRILSLDPTVSLRRTAFTHSTGIATIEDALGVSVRIEASAPGYASKSESLSALPKDFKLALEKGVRIKGSVTSRSGRDPVKGARITAYLADVTRELHTDAKGEFQLSDVAAGPLRFRIDHDDFVAFESTVEVKTPSSSDRPFELSPIDLQTAGIVEGIVVDKRGNPIAGARVAQREVPENLPIGPLPPGIVETDESGKFRLPSLPEGELTLAAVAPGIGEGKEKRVLVRKERTTRDVRITLGSVSSSSSPAGVASIAITLADAPSSESAFLILSVAPKSTAADAGLRVGDAIVRIDGTTPGSVAEARQRLRGPTRRDVVLEVRRGTSLQRIRVAREQVR